MLARVIHADHPRDLARRSLFARQVQAAPVLRAGCASCVAVAISAAAAAPLAPLGLRAVEIAGTPDSAGMEKATGMLKTWIAPRAG